MSVTRPITELDFDTIKNEVINFIKTNPTFTDYSFEGSALNAIVDILAYNTHNNAYYANMLHNEGFIETAQKRGSVVSKAKELGYVPRSSVCSSAFVDLTVLGINSGIPATITRGTTFSSSNDSGSFTFSVLDNASATIIGGSHKFSNVKISNGTNVTNLFVVDTSKNIRSIFTIPNERIDTSTLKVYVRDSFSSIGREEYKLAKNVYDITGDSKVYYIQESYTGQYNIYFGGNVLGKQPVNGNVIDVDYFVTNDFGNANGCRTFSFSGSFGGATTTNVATKQISFGGGEKESIDSIRSNAVKNNTAKERAVTELDYGVILREKFNFIDSVSVWGGEKNVPPIYGKVFISIKPVSGFVVSEAVKQEVIAPVLRDYTLMTISPVFLDPDYLNLEFSTKIKFNTNKTTRTKLEVEGKVKEAIVNYVNSISKFNTDYLESALTSSITGLDSGIVSASVSKKLSIKLSPLSGTDVSLSGVINNKILPGSIRSTKFNYLTDRLIVVSIKEIPGTFVNVQNIQGKVDTIQSIGIYSAGDVLVKDIGTVNMNTGEYKFTINLDSYISNNRFVSLQFGLVDDDIKTLRNQILTVSGDSEDLIIGLVSNNVVTVETYDK